MAISVCFCERKMNGVDSDPDSEATLCLIAAAYKGPFLGGVPEERGGCVFRTFPYLGIARRLRLFVPIPCRHQLFTMALLAAAGTVTAQQVPDPWYNPPVPRPAYESGQGPLVAIDEAHKNSHTVSRSYKPFAELLRRDGYRVDGFAEPLTSNSLDAVDVLVIANALSHWNVDNWMLPTPSAFTQEEIAALRVWVETGGSLVLIADHMPFSGAAAELAKAFGIDFSNGFAVPGGGFVADPDTFALGTGLKESVVTRGRADEETVTKVVTFVGSAFRCPEHATAVIEFGPNSVSHETARAWSFTNDTPMVPIEGWCQGAIMKAGRGRLAVFGEAAMFSAQRVDAELQPWGMNAPGAEQNHQLLLNVMHWLTGVIDPPQSLFSNAAELGDGWIFSGWFGSLNTDSYPWIFHERHSWMYVWEPSGPENVFLFDLGASGWLFTASGLYPNLFSFPRNA